MRAPERTRLILSAVLAFALAACGGVAPIHGKADAGVGPCAHVTCSGHGTCAASGSDAVCACETGYHVDGSACLPGDPVDGGVSGPCSLPWGGKINDGDSV